MRIAGKSYSHIGTWGPVEISDSFVARTNKLISASGNGEAKFYVGGKQDKSLRDFFGKSKVILDAHQTIKNRLAFGGHFRTFW